MRKWPMWMWVLTTDNTQQRESGQCGCGPRKLITLSKGKVVNVDVGQGNLKHSTKGKWLMWMWALSTDNTQQRESGHFEHSVQKILTSSNRGYRRREGRVLYNTSQMLNYLLYKNEHCSRRVKWGCFTREFLGLYLDWGRRNSTIEQTV
jgi:hypothetical protein